MNEKFYITHLQKGDEFAFKMLFERYHARLCYFAKAYLPSTETAEDIVQDAFLKFWHKREDFDSLRAIKSYLYIVVKNSCLNIHKHQKVRKKYADTVSVESEKTEVQEHLIEAEVLDNIHRALQKLPEGCRTVMQLSYFEGMKNKEVAAHLQISVNTVKTQRRRGVELLKNLVKMTMFFI